MKEVQRYLCQDCMKNLSDAQLVYKKIPGSEDSQECEWCRKRRYCTKVRILYGRDKE